MPLTPNDYCTAIEVIESAVDVGLDNTSNKILEELASRASRMVDLYTKREQGYWNSDTDEIRLFDGSGTRVQRVDHQAAVPTTVEVAEGGDLTSYTTWVVTDFLTFPYDALQRGYPIRRLDIDQLNGTKTIWFRFPQSVRVTGKFGGAEVRPDDINMATIMQVLRWYKRLQQGMQDTGGILELGQMTFTKNIDPEIGEMLSHRRSVTI